MTDDYELLRDLTPSLLTLSALLTAAEKQALHAALLEAFGGCTCDRWVSDHRGRPWQLVDTCDGHHFLDERDTNCSRVERLLYVRRTAEAWTKAEFQAS